MRVYLFIVTNDSLLLLIIQSPSNFGHPQHPAVKTWLFRSSICCLENAMVLFVLNLGGLSPFDASWIHPYDLPHINWVLSLSTLPMLLYTSSLSTLTHLFSSLASSFLYKSLATPWITLVALFWIFSRSTITCLRWDDQNCTEKFKEELQKKSIQWHNDLFCSPSC